MTTTTTTTTDGGQWQMMYRAPGTQSGAELMAILLERSENRAAVLRAEAAALTRLQSPSTVAAQLDAAAARHEALATTARAALR